MWSRSSFVFESRWILFFFPTSLRNWWMVEDFSKPTIFYSQLLPFSRLICLNFLTLPHQFTSHLSLSFSIYLSLSLFLSRFLSHSFTLFSFSLSLSLCLSLSISESKTGVENIFMSLTPSVSASLWIFLSECLHHSIYLCFCTFLFLIFSK